MNIRKINDNIAVVDLCWGRKKSKKPLLGTLRVASQCPFQGADVSCLQYLSLSPILHRRKSGPSFIVRSLTVRKDSATTIPPFRMYNEPVASMRKPGLQQLCEHFEQPTDGTVPTLKARLQKYLRNNRARLQDDVRYKGLFPHLGHQDPAAAAVGSAQPTTYAPAAVHSNKNMRRPDQERLGNGPHGSPRESLALSKHVPSNANQQNVGCVRERPRSSK